MRTFIIGDPKYMKVIDTDRSNDIWSSSLSSVE